MKQRPVPVSGGSLDAILVEARGRRPLTKRRIRHEVIPILEFAWASGLLCWSPEEYATALLSLFPKEFAADPIIELSKHAFKMERRRRVIMKTGERSKSPETNPAKG